MAIILVCFSFIYQRSNQQLVLTVVPPPMGNDPFSLDYTPAHGFEGATVVVAHRKSCVNGNANQLWRFDPITGFIEAMVADTTNTGKLIICLLQVIFVSFCLLSSIRFHDDNQ